MGDGRRLGVTAKEATTADGNSGSRSLRDLDELLEVFHGFTE